MKQGFITFITACFKGMVFRIVCFMWRGGVLQALNSPGFRFCCEKPKYQLRLANLGPVSNYSGTTDDFALKKDGTQQFHKGFALRPHASALGQIFQRGTVLSLLSAMLVRGLILH